MKSNAMRNSIDVLEMVRRTNSLDLRHLLADGSIDPKDLIKSVAKEMEKQREELCFLKYDLQKSRKHIENFLTLGFKKKKRGRKYPRLNIYKAVEVKNLKDVEDKILNSVSRHYENLDNLQTKWLLAFNTWQLNKEIYEIQCQSIVKRRSEGADGYVRQCVDLLEKSKPLEIRSTYLDKKLEESIPKLELIKEKQKEDLKIVGNQEMSINKTTDNIKLETIRWMSFFRINNQNLVSKRLKIEQIEEQLEMKKAKRNRINEKCKEINLVMQTLVAKFFSLDSDLMAAEKSVLHEQDVLGTEEMVALKMKDYVNNSKMKELLSP